MRVEVLMVLWLQAWPANIRLDRTNALVTNVLAYFYKENIFMELGFSVSNWQKVQLNTDLFSETQKYLYTEKSA
jgi:hypothetical protein